MCGVDRFSEYIDSAYSVADDIGAFDRFLEETQRFLFGESGGADYAEDAKRLQDDDPVVESHAHRVQKLVNRLVESRDTSEGMERFHAVLHVDGLSQFVTGNAAAETLLDVSFPAHLSKLPIDPALKRAVRARLEAPRGGRDTLLQAEVGSDLSTSCTVVVQDASGEGEGARVLMSYIEWSSDLIERIGTVLSLSPSELQVLGGTLHGQSQREIAEARGRSLETVKAQCKAILRRTGCTRMSDVVSLASSLAYLTREVEGPPDSPTVSALLKSWASPRNGLLTLDRGDGRQVAWVELGAGRRRVMFCHGLVQGPFLQRSIINALTHRDFCLVAPSRPGFGYTSPSRSREDYIETATDDALAIADHVGLSETLVIGHQAGSRHATHLANRLGDGCTGLFIIDGGPPVHEKDALRHMAPDSRMMAGLSCSSPALLKMTTRVALPVYKAFGIEAFLRRLYGPSEADMRALDRPDILLPLAQGIFHTAQQGEDIWVREGQAVMGDWEDALRSCRAHQHWLVGDDAKILDPDYTRTWVETLPTATFDIVEGAGNTLMSTHPDAWMTALERLHAGAAITLDA